MLTVKLEKEALSEAEADDLMGSFVGDEAYDVLIDEEDAEVYKPDGTPLILFRKRCLPAAACQTAYPALRKAASVAGNRGLAAGNVPGRVWGGGSNNPRVIRGSGVRSQPVKKDGTLSNTNYAQNVPSGVIGYMDRAARFPFCRLTAFNLEHPEKFGAAMPLIKAIDETFAREVPERYAAQKAVVEDTHPDFVIHGTVFTTITVNSNWRTACHKDAGDLKEGFGVMTAFRVGKYRGGYLVFPRYRVAVSMSTQDLLLADVHEVHGNTPIVGIKGAYERLSLVLYYRERMKDCGSAKQEQDRAKNRKPGDPLFGK